MEHLESARGRCGEFNPLAAVSHLPEPGSLQDGEGAAQQLQQDVAAVEDLEEGDERAAKDRVEKQLVHEDVQHGPAVQVVQEEETWPNTHRHTQKQIFSRRNIKNKSSHLFLFMYLFVYFKHSNGFKRKGFYTVNR